MYESILHYFLSEPGPPIKMSNLLVGKFRQVDNIDEHYEIIMSHMEISND